MAIDGESTRDEIFTLDNGQKVAITLKVRDIVFIRLLKELNLNLEKLKR
jgi:hypothetical protein